MEDSPNTQTSIDPSKSDAYMKGYNDYWRHIKAPPISILHPTYNPVLGEEKAYDEGWKQAEKEVKERQGFYGLT